MIETNGPGLTPTDEATPRARDWFWRPWYAKAWWSVAGAAWPALYIAARHGFFQDGPNAVEFLFLMMSHPFVIAPVLGFNFFKRAWEYRWRGAEHGTPADFEERWEEYCEWQHDRPGPYPTDPRDRHWHNHPANPMSYELQRYLQGGI